MKTKKAILLTTGIIQLLLALSLIGIAFYPYIAPKEMNLYADPEGATIQYGTTFTTTVRNDNLGTDIDYYQWYLDEQIQLTPDGNANWISTETTFTTPNNLPIGNHQLRCTDYTGQEVHIYLTVTASTPTTTEPPNQLPLQINLTPLSVTIQPSTSQTFTLTIQGGTPQYTIYYQIDNKPVTAFTTTSTTNQYTLTDLQTGSHTFKVTVTDNILQSKTTTAILTVTNNIPTPNPSPTFNPTTTPTNQPTQTPNNPQITITQAIEAITSIPLAIFGTATIAYSRKHN